jgi:hypothetical protein
LWLAALRGGFGLPAVQLEYNFARHLLNQQLKTCTVVLFLIC